MKYLLLALVLSGCGAGLSETALVRTRSGLEGLKSFYEAVCVQPPEGKEQVCEDARGALNEVGELFNEINEAVGEE